MLNAYIYDGLRSPFGVMQVNLPQFVLMIWPQLSFKNY